MKKAIRRSGFTLIEMLVVIAIIGILATFLLPRVIAGLEAAKTTACQKNLQDVYSGLLLFDTRLGNVTSIQDEPGVKFFLKIWKYEVWDHSEGSAKKLTCPAVKYGTLEGLKGKKYEEWFNEWEALDGTYSSYAGRDIKNHALRKLSVAGEPLVCDDNDGGMNHTHTTNVLMSDGSVTNEQLDLILLQQEGTIAKDEKVLIVGPDSPIPLLQKFSLD